jgi:2-polyprenyl-3-methyl-5-hydroxy-6-metoxy-1,4-benzoquinol methylase
MTTNHQLELSHKERFAFGDNWWQFIRHLSEKQITEAEKSLKALVSEDITNQSFLDIGCGSGLFSLAARRLGAQVYSFDYDPRSVACASKLKEIYFANDNDWTIEEGSVLDKKYLAKLGSFDIVYSWGVLHHTSNMWQSLENIHDLVANEGLLCIAIYNDQGRKSDFWRLVKRTYNLLPPQLQSLFTILVMLPFEMRIALISILTLSPQSYLKSWTEYRSRRGMNRWYDMKDWVGGYPYEVATINAITDFYQARGFRLNKVIPTTSLGCNQFLFQKIAILN